MSGDVAAGPIDALVLRPGVRSLGADALRPVLDPATLGFATTREVEPLDGMICQPRVAAALNLAMGMEGLGYNVFATGPPGTGKRSVLESELRRRAAARPAPPDWVYLHDFTAADRPVALRLPTGRAPALAEEVAGLVEAARREVRAAFGSDAYRERHHGLHQALDTDRDAAMERLKAAARADDVAVELTPAGIGTLPLDAGRPIAPEAFRRLPPERQAHYEHALARLRTEVEETFAGLREIERHGREEHERLDRETALAAIAPLFAEAAGRWATVERLTDWLGALRDDLLERLDVLRDGEDEPGPEETLAPGRARRSVLGRYEVNVFITSEPGDGAPVVAVHDCSYYDLFGRVDYETVYGAAVTDHRHVRPGAVHRAAGGYLLLQGEDVLAKPFVWGRLKEVLRTGRARIENLGTQYMLFPSASLEPEPIEVGVTVVLAGTTRLYALLHELDSDVRRLFKVRADFDATTPWDAAAVAGYAGFVSRQVADRGLRHLDAGAVARLVEHGARLAEDRERLSTRFPELADAVAEADHWAGLEGADTVSAAHVERALRERRRRVDLPDHRLREHTLEGTMRIELAGTAVGQVNGLAVVQVGEHAFGHPMRVSATVAAGEGDLVDIDREAELSGPVHDKGVLILAGLLRHLYCRDTPPALRASLVFEQSYGAVEGDSASGAELFALVSALAGVPLAQHIAVTGSVDQRGRIQAIGGVNEKVEGFFALCRDAGLTGDQGVIVPAANLRHLALDPEVVAAVREGAFHVWPIATVDEGLELLTGLDAAAVHARAQAQVAALAERARADPGYRRSASHCA